jgi:leader peptidase (prepilin peptidase) / N-methyltransferase
MSVIALLAASPAVFIGTCLVLGLAVGSFLNVVIYRLPIMLERQWHAEQAHAWQSDATLPAAVATASTEPFNLMIPRSACPSCHTPITALQNIPVVSWLALGGRCAQCRARIGARYPLVEALTALLSATVAWQFGFGWAAAGALVLTWFLVALTFIDIDHQLLPDSLTLPLLWAGVTFSLIGFPGSEGRFPVDLHASVLGAIAGYVSLWSVYHLFRLITGKEGMGYGDFKLLAALGAWLGWQMLFPIILVAAVTGTLVGGAFIVLRRRDHSIPIPFGPFLATGGWLALIWGPRLAARYPELFPLHG